MSLRKPMKMYDLKSTVSVPLKVKIIVNYPLSKGKNRIRETIEKGTLHVKVWINGTSVDVKYIFYCLSKNKVWVNMPDRPGRIKNKICQFPIFSFSDRETQREFIRLTRIAMRSFMNTMKYKSFERWQIEEKLRIEEEEKEEEKERQVLIKS